MPFLHGKGCFFTLSRGNCQGNNDSFLFLRLVALRLGRMLHKSVVPVQRQLTQLTKYISVVRSVYYKRQKRHVFLLSLKKRLSCSCFTSRVRCVAFKSRLENNQDIHLAKQIHNCAFSSTSSLGFSLALQKFDSSSLLPFSNHKKLTNVTISITRIVIDIDRTNKKVAVSIFIQCSAAPTVHKLLMHYRAASGFPV